MSWCDICEGEHDERFLEREAELLPCPFCGGHAAEVVEGGSIIVFCSSKTPLRAGCGARIARALVPRGWTYAVDHCRRAWNQREAKP